MKAHLDLDSSRDKIQDGNLVYAKNVVVQKDGSVVNENGVLSVIAGSTYYFIGKIELSEGFVSFFTSGVNTKIIRYENGVATTVLDTQYLSLSLHAPVRGVASYNAQGQLRIIFWDGVNTHSHKPCFLNLDELPFAVDAVTKELTDPDQITKIYLFPDYNIPNIEIVSIDNGGAIETGKYQFLIKYEVAYGDYTDYTLPTREVWIGDINVDTLGWPMNSSSLMGEYANKIVNFEIQNLDTRYTYAVLCAIQNTGSSKKYIEIERFSIPASGPLTISYSGQSIDTLLTIGDVISRVKLDRIHTGVLNNRKLAIANFKVKDRLDYQKHANSIQLSWTATPLSELGAWATPEQYAYSNGRTIYYNRGFMPDEIYAFYIHWVYKDGTVSEGYHIPGREIIGAEDAVIPYVPTGSRYSGVASGAQVFQLMNTTDSTNGMFGYWQNKNEFYPSATEDVNGDYEYWDNGVHVSAKDLHGKNVRHHKFPSPHYMYSVGEDTDKVLGLIIDNVYVPQGMEDLVQGYFISFAKRNVEDITVWGMADLVNQYWSATSQGGGDSAYYRIHDFFLLSLLPTIQIDYIKGYYATTSTHVIIDSGLGDIFAIASYNDYQDNIDIIDNVQYVNADNVAFTDSGGITNQYKEGALMLHAKYPELSAGDHKPYMTGYTMWNALGSAVSNFVVGGLYTYRTDVYTSFLEQDLISTGYFFKLQHATVPGQLWGLQIAQSKVTVNSVDHNLCGGDTFLSNQMYDYSIDSIVPGTRYHAEIQGVHRYSPINYQWRLEPETGWSWTPGIVEKNDYMFNNNWTLFYQLRTLFAYDYNIPYINRFPYRVARSLNEQLDSLEERLRTFIYSDYYEMPKEKGEIYGLESQGNTLFIQHTGTLYLAKAKDNMSVDGVDVGLAQRDIFDSLPQEVLSSKYGTIGCQSMFAMFTCELGYVVCDRKKGIIYLISQTGEVQEISDIDCGTWFSNNLNTIIDIDNPYLFNGLVAAYDGTKRHKRIIVSKRQFIIPFEGTYVAGTTYHTGDIVVINDEYVIYNDKTPPSDKLPLTTFVSNLDSQSGTYGYVNSGFTISFSLYNGSWCSFHDYFPKSLFSSRYKIYGVLANIYEHNVATNKGIYYDSTTVPHDSFIDVFHNDGNINTKLFKFTSWICNTYLNGVYRWDLNIDKVMLYNNNQCSGLITLNDLADWFETNVEKTIYGISHFKDFRDGVIDNKALILDSQYQPVSANVNINSKDYFDLSYFISTFAVLRLCINNTAISTLYKEVIILDNKCEFNKSTL